MVRLIVGVAALLCMIVAGVASVATASDIVSRVNERLPPDQRISPLGSWNQLRAVRIYPQLIPDGPLRRRMFVFAAIAVTSWAVLALCIFLPGW